MLLCLPYISSTLQTKVRYCQRHKEYIMINHTNLGEIQYELTQCVLRVLEESVAVTALCHSVLSYWRESKSKSPPSWKCKMPLWHPEAEEAPSPDIANRRASLLAESLLTESKQNKTILLERNTRGWYCQHSHNNYLYVVASTGLIPLPLPGNQNHRTHELQNNISFCICSQMPCVQVTLIMFSDVNNDVNNTR